MRACSSNEIYEWELDNIREEFSDALGIDNYDRAMELTKRVFVLVVDKYKYGEGMLRSEALPELRQLSKDFSDLDYLLKFVQGSKQK